MIAAIVAAVALHAIVFVDAGSRPIYGLQIGHASANVWSRDLLGYADALDVSQGRELPLQVDDADCRQDVRATFDDGRAVVVSDVDLCTSAVVRISDP